MNVFGVLPQNPRRIQARPAPATAHHRIAMLQRSFNQKHRRHQLGRDRVQPVAPPNTTSVGCNAGAPPWSTAVFCVADNNPAETDGRNYRYKDDTCTGRAFVHSKHVCGEGQRRSRGNQARSARVHTHCTAARRAPRRSRRAPCRGPCASPPREWHSRALGRTWSAPSPARSPRCPAEGCPSPPERSSSSRPWFDRSAAVYRATCTRSEVIMHSPLHQAG